METLSVEKRIEELMLRLDLTAEFLGSLTAAYGFRGLPQPRISQALRGTKPFTNEQSTFLLKLLQDLEDLISKVRLVQPVFRDPLLTKRILDLHKEGNLLVILEAVE